jgi:uncharacterized membrane protein YphA (DoxX/SURF4 family)
MNTVLWIVAGLLAVVFLFAGSSKLFVPREKLAKAPGGGWVFSFSAGFVKTLGAFEILGAVGLILPALLNILPVLVPLAAASLAMIMVGASIVTYRRQELKHVVVNLTISVSSRVGIGAFRRRLVHWLVSSRHRRTSRNASHPSAQLRPRGLRRTSI